MRLWGSRLERLLAAAGEQLAEAQAPQATLDEEQRRQLASLGYVTSAGTTGGRLRAGQQGPGLGFGDADQLVKGNFLTAQVVLGGDFLRAVTRSEARLGLARVSVMVEVPTSKLRLANASCSFTASFCARTKASVSCAASTSK